MEKNSNHTWIFERFLTFAQCHFVFIPSLYGIPAWENGLRNRYIYTFDAF